MRMPDNTFAQKYRACRETQQRAKSSPANKSTSPLAILDGGLHRWPTQRYYAEQNGVRLPTAFEAIDDKQAVAYALRLYGGAEARVERRSDFGSVRRVVVLS